MDRLEPTGKFFQGIAKFIKTTFHMVTKIDKKRKVTLNNKNKSSRNGCIPES